MKFLLFFALGLIGLSLLIAGVAALYGWCVSVKIVDEDELRKAGL